MSEEGRKRKRKSSGDANVPAAATLVKRLLRQGNRRFGDDTFHHIDDASSNVKMRLDTGNPVINTLFSGDPALGIATGRIVELYGKEHVGKTTLGCHIAATAQRRHGAAAVIVDTESTLTKERVLSLGVDPESLIYNEEVFIEEVCEQLQFFAEKFGKTPCVVFWDTIASTISKRHAGRGIGEGAIALEARALAQGMARLAKPLAQSNTVVIACNQLKAGGFASPYPNKRQMEATKGGSAMKFHADARLSLDFGGDYRTSITGRKRNIGMLVTAAMSKNKQMVNDTRAHLVFDRRNGGRFDNGLSTLKTLIAWDGCRASKVAGVRQHANIESPDGSGKTLSERKWLHAYAQSEEFRSAAHNTLQRAFRARYMIEDTESEIGD